MIPLRLYINNFMCHSDSYIDFSQFESALIVGKIGDNDLYSNGVGKTVIFRAIEYALFNQAGSNLEKVIRDDTNSCKVVLDFEIDNQEYRLSRSRTRKGVADFSLYMRNDVASISDKAYHTVSGDVCIPISDSKVISKYWKDIGGSRASDTDKELQKLIKCTYASFRSALHFMQNDFTGLATATAGKRKAILREALTLLVYSKLEKIAKDRSKKIIASIGKNQILIDNLGDPNKDITSLNSDLKKIECEIGSLEQLMNDSDKGLLQAESILSGHKEKKSVLESKLSDLLSRKRSVLLEIDRLTSLIAEYKEKRKSIAVSAKVLVGSLKEFNDEKSSLMKIDSSNYDDLVKKLDELKETISTNNVLIQNNILKIDELKVPMPDDSVCKHCRQPLTDEHKKLCKQSIRDELLRCEAQILKLKSVVSKSNSKASKIQSNIKKIDEAKKRIDVLDIKISSLKKEIKDKKASHAEYSDLVDKFSSELSVKNDELKDVGKLLEESSADELSLLEVKINEAAKILEEKKGGSFVLNKKKTHLNSNKAVIIHSIDQKKKDLETLKELNKEVKNLKKKNEIYPTVIQSFSPTGIPNLITQNVLDELQDKANELLNQLKPGLQLAFSVEKTKGDGNQEDTLEIEYFFNGKPRDYDLISGAMQLSVLFSLKLGLSFLLKEKTGFNIQFLLLDEIDQSLDKAGVDAFADIVKFFQDNFKILIITHNDRLKDKFSKAVLVEQDINMVSTAKVVTSW